MTRKELIDKIKAKYSTKNGLVYEGKRLLGVREADQLARSVGMQYAEDLVKSLEKPKGSK